MTKRDQRCRVLVLHEMACKAAGLRTVLTSEEEAHVIRIGGVVIGVKPASAEREVAR